MVDNIVRSTDEDVNIEICGFCTDICVVSNALLLKTKLYDIDRVNISILENCCAGVSPQNHFAACTTMRSNQIDIKPY
jgi:nicotinamidase-related amidase